MSDQNNLPILSILACTIFALGMIVIPPETEVLFKREIEPLASRISYRLTKVFFLNNNTASVVAAVGVGESLPPDEDSNLDFLDTDN